MIHVYAFLFHSAGVRISAEERTCMRNYGTILNDVAKEPDKATSKQAGFLSRQTQYLSELICTNHE